MLSHCLVELLWQRMAVEEDVCGVECHIVARHIPCTLVMPTLAPRVLHHIVWLAMLIDSLAVDEHHMVVSKAASVA